MAPPAAASAYDKGRGFAGTEVGTDFEDNGPTGVERVATAETGAPPAEPPVGLIATVTAGPNGKGPVPVTFAPPVSPTRPDTVGPTGGVVAVTFGPPVAWTRADTVGPLVKVLFQLLVHLLSLRLDLLLLVPLVKVLFQILVHLLSLRLDPLLLVPVAKVLLQLLVHLLLPRLV